MTKLRLTIIITLMTLASILLVACNEKETVSLDNLIKTMQESSLNIEANEADVTSTHYAYDPESKTFFLGLQFEDDKLPSEEQQQNIYEKFLSKASEVTTTGDWRNALESYNVTFEQLLSNNDKKTLALKKSDSDTIELVDTK